MSSHVNWRREPPPEPTVGRVNGATFQATNNARFEVKIEKDGYGAEIGWDDNTDVGRHPKFGPWFWDAQAVEEAAEFFKKVAAEMRAQYKGSPF